MPTGELTLPRPENVRGRFGSFVTADMFHIAERLQEIDKNLFIEAFDNPITMGDQTWNFAIIEWIPSLHKDELVTRVEALDARVIEHVQYLLHVPFEVRFAEAERLEDQRKEDARKAEVEEMYERMGRAFWYQLEHDGFNSGRGVSFPKRGVARHGR